MPKAPCPRHDWKAAQPDSRFCKMAKKRLSAIRENLKAARAVYQKKKAASTKKTQYQDAERNFMTWKIASRSAPAMYCRLCHIGCKRGRS